MLGGMLAEGRKIAVVVPLYNEEENIPVVYSALKDVFGKLRSYDPTFYFVDDGSVDGSASVVERLSINDNRVRLVMLSRNFGKEAALSAGIQQATDADAVVLIDGDMQHPPDHIPSFLAAWEKGADVVIGVRESNPDESIFRRTCSRIFSGIMNALSSTPTVRGATDFRVLDQQVVRAFSALSERNRITRSLIDWLGFRRAYIPFVASARHSGAAQYSIRQLIRLAFTAFISHSLLPLRFAGYLGVPITLFSGGLGLFVLIEQLIMGDPLQLQVPGTAMLAIMILFLNGIVLLCLGLVSMYIAHIHDETTRRPLFILRKERFSEK
jgi:dolichol-phosphate mannosyltransferase